MKNGLNPDGDDDAGAVDHGTKKKITEGEREVKREKTHYLLFFWPHFELRQSKKKGRKKYPKILIIFLHVDTET